MDGFKNTTKMKYMGAGGMVDGYSMGGYAKGGNAKPMMKGGDAKPMMAKGGNAKVGAKISKVMGEFKKGDLHSGSKDGPKVKSSKQAMAIALSEAGKGKGKMPMKKNEGGKIGKMPPLGESVKSGNRMSKMTAAEMRAMEERFGNKRRPSPGDSVKSGNRIAKEEADEARHLGVFKKGGKVRKYAEGGAVEPAMKRSMPAFDASAVYQDFGRELKGLIDSGQLTLEQANALKGDAFQATRYRDVGQQQEAMKAALAGARGRMESMIPTAPRGLSGLALEGLKNASIMKEPLPPMMTELPMGVGAAPMKVPTTRPDPNVIQPTIVTANGRVPNPAYTADVAMQRYRTQLPNNNYYSPQELQQIMSSIENAYSQPGATGQQVGSAYRNASAAATRARPTVGAPMQPPLMMEQPTPPPMQKIYEPRRPPMTPPPLQNLGQGLQRIQQRQRPGMDPVDPGFAIDRGGYDMTAPPAGMAPVDPNKAMMMRHGGRAAMPKRGR